MQKCDLSVISNSFVNKDVIIVQIKCKMFCISFSMRNFNLENDRKFGKVLRR